MLKMLQHFNIYENNWLYLNISELIAPRLRDRKIMPALFLTF